MKPSARLQFKARKVRLVATTTLLNQFSMKHFSSVLLVASLCRLLLMFLQKLEVSFSPQMGVISKLHLLLAGHGVNQVRKACLHIRCNCFGIYAVVVVLPESMYFRKSSLQFLDR